MIPPLAVIFAWPLAGIAFFRSMPLPVAVCWCIVAGYLFLPTQVAFDLPILPSIDKNSVPSLVALVAILVLAGKTKVQDGAVVLRGWLPASPILLLLCLGLLASAALTVLSNPDPLPIGGGVVLPGLRTYDAFAAVLSGIIELLPFLIARRLLGHPEQHRNLLRILCLAGLIYSVPILFEVRFSPQLNQMIYGFFPHSWIQHIRGGHYRPLVFLEHGLWLAIFMAGTALAAFTMFRIGMPGSRGKYLAAGLWLVLILYLCRSLGSLVIGLLFISVLLLMKPRLQVVFAACLVGVIMLYPLLRGAGLIPVERVNNLAASISDERSRSLQFRLLNEERLLEKANQRPVFGWGGWGRSLLYGEDASLSSTTDGFWVIAIGRDGWVGYLCRFGLLGIPIIILAIRRRRYALRPETAGICLILTANMVDLIPNASLTQITWLLAGALAGRLELTGREVEAGQAGEDPEQGRREVRYSRFGHDRPTAYRLHRSLEGPEQAAEPPAQEEDVRGRDGVRRHR